MALNTSIIEAFSDVPTDVPTESTMLTRIVDGVATVRAWEIGETIKNRASGDQWMKLLDGMPSKVNGATDIDAVDVASDPPTGVPSASNVQLFLDWLETTVLGRVLLTQPILPGSGILINGSPAIIAIGTINAISLVAAQAALAPLTPAANKVARYTGAATADLLDFDTDATLAANSATRIPSQSAVKIYVDAAVAPLAPINAPVFTGSVRVPTVAGVTDSSTLAASTAFVIAVRDALLASAPGALDTINELAIALGNDPNLATTLTNLIATKQPLHAILTALAAQTVGANEIAYSTGVNAFARAALSAYMRGLLATADVAALRTAIFNTLMAALSAGNLGTVAQNNQLRMLSDTAATLATYTGLRGQPTWDYTNGRLAVHDSTTAGGIVQARFDDLLEPDCFPNNACIHWDFEDPLHPEPLFTKSAGQTAIRFKANSGDPAVALSTGVSILTGLSAQFMRHVAAWYVRVTPITGQTVASISVDPLKIAGDDTSPFIEAADKTTGTGTIPGVAAGVFNSGSTFTNWGTTEVEFGDALGFNIISQTNCYAFELLFVMEPGPASAPALIEPA